MPMWSEKYRPNDLSEYRGNYQNKQMVKNYVESVIKGNPNAEGLLLHGPHGTGKTSLVMALRESYSVPLNYTNASDHRKKDDVEKILRAGVSKPFQKKCNLTVLDEAEKIPSKITPIIDNTNLIVICNDKYELSTETRNRLREVKFDEPSNRSKRKYADYILNQEDEHLPNRIIKKVVAQSPSFRQVAINLQLALVGEEDFSMKRYDLGLFDEVKALFSGNREGRSDIDPDELLMWAMDNDGNPAFVAKLDRILGKSDDYRGWKYVYDLIKYSGANSDYVQYPRFIKLLSKYKGGSK